MPSIRERRDLVVSGRTVKRWDARPWTRELKSESRHAGTAVPECEAAGEEQLIESIRNDATISEPVRRHALELAETY